MKKRTRILILGVAMMLIMAMSGCGVNHKSPEGVVEALIKNYVSGSEKKVKQCYSQEKDTNELLQNEIDATLKYFAAHNPTKVKVEQCDILSENGDYTYVYIIYNLVLENDQEYPCGGKTAPDSMHRIHRIHEESGHQWESPSLPDWTDNRFHRNFHDDKEYSQEQNPNSPGLSVPHSQV